MNFTFASVFFVTATCLSLTAGFIQHGATKPRSVVVDQFTIAPIVRQIELARAEQERQRLESSKTAERMKAVAAITTRYKVDEQLALQIVKLAKKHQRDDFPKASDIIAIIGVESSFRPNVKSQLKKDPAVGLMQVRPGVWKIPHVELSTIEGQIKHGARILAEYYDSIGRKDGAVMAYNIGITAYRKGRQNPRYLNKYKRELANLRENGVSSL